MSYMVVLIVDDIEQCPAVMDAWEEAVVSGVTTRAITGLGRVRRTGLRDDMPMTPSLHDLFMKEEVLHRTLLSVVETQKWWIKRSQHPAYCR